MTWIYWSADCRAYANLHIDMIRCFLNFCFLMLLFLLCLCFAIYIYWSSFVFALVCLISATIWQQKYLFTIFLLLALSIISTNWFSPRLYKHLAHFTVKKKSAKSAEQEYLCFLRNLIKLGSVKNFFVIYIAFHVKF